MARIRRRTIQKSLIDLGNHDDVVTYLEADNLKCEVKRAIGSITIKLVELMEFHLSYLKS